LAALGLAFPEPAPLAVLVAAVGVGLLVGLGVARRLPPHVVRVAVLGLAIVGGTIAILRGVA
jgi:hypothetical protein